MEVGRQSQAFPPRGIRFDSFGLTLANRLPEFARPLGDHPPQSDRPREDDEREHTDAAQDEHQSLGGPERCALDDLNVLS